MPVFCTIITPDFIPFAKCLHSSILLHLPGAVMYVLVTDEEKRPDNGLLRFLRLGDLNSEQAVSIRKKYEGFNDHLRWPLKPALILQLLEEHEEVIYTDADLCFFGSLQPLLDGLKHHSILLTPHGAPADPFRYREKFEMNFLSGLYNAGFVAVNRRARNALQWWATACYFRMEDDKSNGYFVDQRYLDLVPVIDPQAGIVHHQGCNIGSWNIESFRRETKDDGTVLINGKFEVIFIHFNGETIRHILNGDDAALRPYFERYRKLFAAGGCQLDDFILSISKWDHTPPHQQIKRTLRLRTRLKRFLFQLAKKL